VWGKYPSIITPKFPIPMEYLKNYLIDGSTQYNATNGICEVLFPKSSPDYGLC